MIYFIIAVVIIGVGALVAWLVWADKQHVKDMDALDSGDGSDPPL